MTERIDALTVILEKPVRIDAIAPLANAIREMRGVIEVIPVVRQVPTAAIAELRIRQELYQKVREILEPDMFDWPIEPGSLDGAIQVPI